MKARFLIAMIVAVMFNSCKHEPLVLSPSVDVITTTNTGNNGGGNNNGGNVITCDTNVIYFNQDILPILISNCTSNPNNASGSGCHDANSHQENVILTSYQTVMNTGGVVPGNINSGHLIKSITTHNSDDRMPPSPMQALSTFQIALIQNWILQGAKDTSCINSGCDSTNVSFANKIWPIINNNCLGCHSGNTPGGSTLLIDYPTVSAAAANGKLIGTITYATGFHPMPKYASPLSSCQIAIIRNWISEGMLNN